MTDVLFRWPETAKFGRPVTKTKLYENGVVSSAVKKRFIAQVEEITWAYKLAESTINLPGSSEVPEIQIVVIHAKANDVDDAVLATIDKAIKQPVIFEIVTADGTRMTATLKAGSTGGRYYSSEWSQEDARRPLPPGVTLADLYAALLDSLLPIRVRRGEGLSELADRLAAIARLEREISALTRKLRAEPQLNRKVELRRALKTQQASLADVTKSTTASTMTKTN
ncbi:DUF4391 domain-containing protein [uncultured Serinicoccus sp.]|uniref:DUF4391 domain-containing protein n=1 Tax=uncultured Serinicoccus sp. TaxID=735514 RepID=UPI002619A9A4|nr:DUF4391 domain-containing protein [uncultured Serinicoccus sp.]